MLNDSSSPIEQNSVQLTRGSAMLLVLFALILFVVAQIFAGTIVAGYGGATHHHNVQQWLADSVQAQFFFILLAEAATIGGVIGSLGLFNLRLATIGLRRPRWSDLAYGLAAVLPYIMLYALTVGVASSLVKGLDVNQAQDIGFKNVHGTLPLVLTFFSLAILPPLAEEILVRGLLYTSLKKAMPLFWAVIVTSALFAAAHLGEGGAAGPLYIGALDTFVLSLVLIYLREKTGGLWSSITLHAIKNSVAFVALFVLHAR
jgi:membrane protease YdiL (CAAX protease family)